MNTQPKILIYGKNGQVGTALQSLLVDNASVLSSQEFDFFDINKVNAVLGDVSVNAVINAVAYTDVNKAEEEEELAYKINALVPEAIAIYCKERNIPFIHYSTDYVFPGEGDAPYTENDQTSPLNVYGRTKLAGEEKISKIGGKYLILRTSWVFDNARKNFLTTMLKLAQEREDLSIVNDQIGAPTYAPHLAEASIRLCKQFIGGNGDSGIYHLCNSGYTSWYSFALEIFKQAKDQNINLKIKEVKPITSEEFPSKVIRPKNSRLDCSKIKRNFGIEMPNWRDGLFAAME